MATMNMPMMKMPMMNGQHVIVDPSMVKVNPKLSGFMYVNPAMSDMMGKDMSPTTEMPPMNHPMMPNMQKQMQYMDQMNRITENSTK